MIAPVANVIAENDHTRAPGAFPSAVPIRAAGDGTIHAEHVAGRTSLTRLAAHSPLKLLAPRRESDAAARVFVSSYGGGLLGGDELSLRVRVGTDATLALGTQASTKIYRTHDGEPARQRLNAALEPRATLVVLPDPLTPFAGSAYEQRQSITMHPSSTLVLLDWITAGRTAREERWAFNHYQSHTEVSLDGRCAFADGLLLDPRHDALDQPHRMGRFNCLATVLLLGDPLRDVCAEMHEAVRQEPMVKRADTLCVTSPIGGGLVLRLAGVETESVASILRERLAFIEHLIGDYWARKW